MKSQSLPEKNALVLKDLAPDGIVELMVWSAPAVNHRLLICHDPDCNGGNPTNLVRVLVRDNTNFLKKMRLLARRVADKRYSLEGPCPRWKGKW